MSEAVARSPDEADELFARREGTGVVLQAAVQVLSDGKPRRIAALVDDAIRAKLLPETASKNAITMDLRAYVFRMLATGRSPVIIENVKTHEFRLNRPVDDWPDVMLPRRPRYIAEATIQAAEQRMRERRRCVRASRIHDDARGRARGSGR